MNEHTLEVMVTHWVEHKDHIDVHYLVNGKQSVKWIGCFSVFAANLRAGNFTECERVLRAHLQEQVSAE